MIVQLINPIQINGAAIRAIQIQQPSETARQRIMAARSIPDRLTAAVEMVSALTGLTVEQVEELDTTDFTRVAEAAIAHVARRRRT